MKLQKVTSPMGVVLATAIDIVDRVGMLHPVAGHH